MTTSTIEITRGEKIMNWINERHAAGMTVYAATATRIIKIAPKHISLVRVKNGHCEVCQGKRWDSINYCNISAQ